MPPAKSKNFQGISFIGWKRWYFYLLIQERCINYIYIREQGKNHHFFHPAQEFFRIFSIKGGNAELIKKGLLMSRQKYISARQASELTGISYVTVLKHLRRGILLHECDREVGEKYQIDVDELIDYARKMWSTGHLMYAPEQIERRIYE
jgi:hypothetical protein